MGVLKPKNKFLFDNNSLWGVLSSFPIPLPPSIMAHIKIILCGMVQKTDDDVYGLGLRTLATPAHLCLLRGPRALLSWLSYICAEKLCP